MKSKKSSGHVEVSPLTYSSKGFSRPRFIFTLILTIIVSLSLIVGGTVTFFGIGSDYFVTVNGKELITPNILESIRSQLSGLDEKQKISSLMQALGPREESLMWTFYGKDHGIQFKAADLYDALKTSYQEQKESYEKEYKSYFPMDYPEFVKSNVDTINLQATLKALDVPNIPDSYNISQEYVLEKTLSTLKYRYASLSSYFLKTKTSDVAQFYNQENHKTLSGKTLLVIPFSSSEEADREAKNLQKDPKLAVSRFASIKQTLNIKSNANSDAYLYVQNVNVGDITPSFSYQGKNYVGKVLSDQFFTFDKLSSKAQDETASSYVQSLKESQIAPIRKMLQQALEKGDIQPYISKGTTLPISIQDLDNIRDTHTSQPLPFASSKNKTLLSYIFASEGSQSPVLEYQNIEYKVQVLQKKNPIFPIPSQEHSKIEDMIKQRENNLWILSARQEMQKGVKVKINTKNLQKILQ